MAGPALATAAICDAVRTIVFATSLFLIRINFNGYDENYARIVSYKHGILSKVALSECSSASSLCRFYFSGSLL